jgi:hypothetical protein
VCYSSPINNDEGNIMIATLVYKTPTLAQRNADRMARVAAAGRIAAERQAREALVAAQEARGIAWADRMVTLLAAEGAVEVGVKVVLAEGGKIRGTAALADARGMLAFWYPEELEVWGLDAEGEYVG